MLYMRVRPSSFLSRSLLRFLRTRASSSYCAQAPPPPAEHAPIRPFCLVPAAAAAAASSAAVARGDGDGAFRTVVDVEPPAPVAVAGGRRCVT